MRAYGTDPVIWDAADGCEHAWNVVGVIKSDAAIKRGPNSMLGPIVDEDREPRDTRSAYCSKCDAIKCELGLEPSYQLYVKHIVQIFHEVKRVLKPTGSLYLNLGDTYSGSGGAGGDYDEGGLREGQPKWKQGNVSTNKRNWGSARPRPRDGTKSTEARATLPIMPAVEMQSKSLIGIPERVMLGMIDDGWILRNKICWSKNNGMPSSVKDRFSTKWEYIYFFVKSSETNYWTNSKTLALVDRQPHGTSGVESADWKWVDAWNQNRKYRDGVARQIKRDDKQVWQLKRSLWTGHSYFFDLDAVRIPLVFNTHASGNKKRKFAAANLKTGHRGTSVPWSPKPRLPGVVPARLLGYASKRNLNPEAYFKQSDQTTFTKGGHSLNIKGHSGYYDKEGNLLVNLAGKNPGDVIQTGVETRTLGAITGERGAVKVPGGQGWTGHPPGGSARIMREQDPRWLPENGKNPGDFFEINTQPLPDAHFASFPEALVERPLKASCPSRVCTKCALPMEKDIRCSCNAGFRAGVILDPFSGSGTVAKVAKDNGRSNVSIEIKKEYCEIMKKRVDWGHNTIDDSIRWLEF